MTRSLAARAETSVATVLACGLAALPLSEIAVRTVFSTGIPGAGPFTKHLTMWVAMLGAAIAARDGKLLSLATGTFFPEGRARDTARVISGAIGAAVTAIFAIGALDYVAVIRRADRELAAGVPEWTTEVVLPLAFALIAWRLAWNASATRAGRAAALAGLALGTWVGLQPSLVTGLPAWPLLALVAVSTLLGGPVFVLLGGAALALFLVDGVPASMPLVDAHAELTLDAIPAIPLFTLAGFVLAEGQAPQRLLGLFRAVFGWLPGGTAIVTAGVCAFFTLLTGGSGVTILALGGLLLPTLVADGYRERFSLGLVTAAGSLGLLFPLALPLLLYSVVARNVSMENLFLGGLLPGTLMLGLVAVLGVREGLLTKASRHPFRWRDAAEAIWRTKWELLLPAVVLGSIFVAGATISESAALAALYAVLVQRFVHRDLASFDDVAKAVGNAVALSGGVLIILAVAVGFTNYLITADVPGRLIGWTEANVHSPLLFLLGLNALLIAVGCLMDVFSAIIVVVPLITPIAATFGIHPVHLGIIFVANLELGYLTPPVGLNLFLSAYRFDKPVLEVARASLPMLGVLAVGVLLITYVPWLTTGLVELFGRP